MKGKEDRTEISRKTHIGRDFPVLQSFGTGCVRSASALEEGIHTVVGRQAENPNEASKGILQSKPVYKTAESVYHPVEGNGVEKLKDGSFPV
ncbi:hypothetical protein TNCV_3560821 [Trichonephila clavipes]|nr:hypothetical protein TNCV_3560821 [Trichonephila clavipes]